MNATPLKEIPELARYLLYPGTEAASPDATTACALAQPFLAALAPFAPGDREELYTSTFDLNPACVPYSGIHLFGEESFKRGEFLAALSAQMDSLGFDPRPEMPDHIANLLQVLELVPESEQRELVEFCILGPLDTMAAALPAGNPYSLLFAAIQSTLRKAFPGIVAAPSPLEKMRAAGACAAINTGCSSCGPVRDSAFETNELQTIAS